MKTVATEEELDELRKAQWLNKNDFHQKSKNYGGCWDQGWERIELRAKLEDEAKNFRTSKANFFW